MPCKPHHSVLSNHLYPTAHPPQSPPHTVHTIDSSSWRLMELSLTGSGKINTALSDSAEGRPTYHPLSRSSTSSSRWMCGVVTYVPAGNEWKRSVLAVMIWCGIFVFPETGRGGRIPRHYIQHNIASGRLTCNGPSRADPICNTYDRYEACMTWWYYNGKYPTNIGLFFRSLFSHGLGCWSVYWCIVPTTSLDIYPIHYMYEVIPFA